MTDRRKADLKLVAFRLKPALWADFVRVADRRGLAYQEAAEQAFRAWVVAQDLETAALDHQPVDFQP